MGIADVEKKNIQLNSDYNLLGFMIVSVNSCCFEKFGGWIWRRPKSSFKGEKMKKTIRKKDGESERNR